jgi:cytoskeletal protein CcmA (bactofilin family)
MIKKTDSGAEISKSTVVRGRVQGAESLSVAGRIEGTVALDAKLTIERSGVVKADVEADEVIVRGILAGNVKARRAIRLEPGSQVKGDLEAPVITVAEGARLSGSLSIGERAPPRIAAPPLLYEPERVAPTEVIMRPVVDDRHKRRIVVKKRT